MKIGIPRALLTYEYPVLYRKFFEFLGIDVVLSDKTNSKIVEDGIKNSVDEACLASKLFIGHVINLIDKSKEEKIDYIFIPRISFFGKKETVCVKFYALIDICKNLFNFKFITLNIDYKNGENELVAFLELGKKLGKNKIESLKAYIRAKRCQRIHDIKRYEKQEEKINNGKKNILIVSHPYVEYDNFLGKQIIEYIEKNNINICYADINSSKISSSKKYNNKYKEISTSIYWRHNKYLLNGVVQYKDKVDGIIYLSTFPCGTDALVNDISIRKVNNVPSLNIVLDEQNSNTGMITRLESFIDILEQNSRVIV